MTGIAMNTILKLLAELGRACAHYQDEHLRGLRCRRIQCDEVSQFCYAKAKNVPPDGRFNELCRARESHDAHVHAKVTRLTNGFSKKVENLRELRNIQSDVNGIASGVCVNGKIC